MNIPITKPLFGEAELRAVQKPLENGWVVQGPFVERFETRFSKFTGARFSIATSSCTTALHMAVAALGLEPGDEVIVPAFTWVSTANVVEYMGAIPVFCDIDLSTFNINTNIIDEMVTSKTAGIIPVHLFGLCADLVPILATAKRHGFWVIEDAACAFGAFYKGSHAGTFGEAACFSFHPRKSITTGEGGMLTTQRKDLNLLSRSLRDHGSSRSDLARHNDRSGFLLSEYDVLGYNYRMTDIQAALGCAQMERADSVLSERSRLARNYDEMLADIDWLRTPKVPDGYVHGYQAYVCLFCPDEPTLNNVDGLHRRRNDLMETLDRNGIATRQGTHAPIATGYYSTKYGLSPAQFPKAYLADRLSLALPLYAQMTEEEQITVVNELRRIRP